MHAYLLIGTIASIVTIALFRETVYGSELLASFLLLASILFVSGRHEIQGEKSEEALFFNRKVPLFIATFFLFSSLTLLRLQFVETPVSLRCDTSCEFTAVVATSPSISHGVQKVVLVPKGYDKVERVLATVPLYPLLRVGDEVKVRGVLRDAGSYKEHLTSSFDYASYLHLHHIGSTMLYPSLTVFDASHEEGLSFWLKSKKEYAVSLLTTYLKARDASLARGMLFGDDALSQNEVTSFRVAGLSHIVALSGFNIAILISAVLFVLFFLPLFVRVILAGVLVLLFVIAVGGEASVVRATLMAFVSLCALLLGRPYGARQALLLSLLAIVLYDPLYVHVDVSLHLSFLATAGLVYGEEVIRKIHAKTSFTFFASLFSTTLVAYLATLPYTMYTFHTMSPYALLANVLALPVVPLLMLTSFLILFFSWVPPLATVFGFLSSLLSEYIFGVASFVEKLPFAQVSFSLSYIAMLVVYGALIAFWWYSTLYNETTETEQGDLLSPVMSF